MILGKYWNVHICSTDEVSKKKSKYILAAEELKIHVVSEDVLDGFPGVATNTFLKSWSVIVTGFFIVKQWILARVDIGQCSPLFIPPVYLDQNDVIFERW